MTFEEWWINEYTTTKLGPGEKQHLIISRPNQKKAWNAAIASSLAALDAAAEAVMLKADPYVDNQMVLTKLLT